MIAGYHYTGVRATEAEEADLLSWAKMPFIVVGGSVPESIEERVHRLARSKGLPEIAGNYGYDLEEHQFICLPGATERPVDAWPSHRLEDVLKEPG